MSFEEDGNIPFITDADDISSGTVSRHYSLGRSLQPTPCHSRSPSFRDDDTSPLKSQRCSSLGDLRATSVGSLVSHCHRRGSSRKSRRSQHSVSRRSSRGNSMRSRPSFAYENGRRKSLRASQRRRRSSVPRRGESVEMSAHQRAKEKRRRVVVFAVIGISLFILLCCVLAVVVTLTHQSEFSLRNKTISYYTFSLHPKLIDDDLSEIKQVRKENEELMNSLNRGHHTPPPNVTTPPVPLKEK